MTLVGEIVFAVGLVVVSLSLAGVLARRVSERTLRVLTGLLAGGAAVFTAALGLNAVERFAESDGLVLAAGGLAAAAVAEAGLVALLHALERLRDYERLTETGRDRIDALLAAHAEERASELERTLSRERANASHLLGEQERRLGQVRRDLVIRQVEQARTELTEAVAHVQEQLERRLASWAADLERGQRMLEARVNELGQRQNEALNAYGARLDADSEQLAAATEEQRDVVNRLRSTFEQSAAELLEQGRMEMEAHALERRRALQELAGRLRERERALREQIDREEAEARARVVAGLSDVERHPIEQLERSLDRAATRLGDEAERRFENQIRQSREKSAERLSNELDKAMEQFARRAEKEVSDRIAQVAQATAERLERRIEQIARSAEEQHEASADRLRIVSERLNAALADAEERIETFETQIEDEVETKLAELERAIRATQT